MLQLNSKPVDTNGKQLEIGTQKAKTTKLKNLSSGLIKYTCGTVAVSLKTILSRLKTKSGLLRQWLFLYFFYAMSNHSIYLYIHTYVSNQIESNHSSIWILALC